MPNDENSFLTLGISRVKLTKNHPNTDKKDPNRAFQTKIAPIKLSYMKNIPKKVYFLPGASKLLLCHL